MKKGLVYCLRTVNSAMAITTAATREMTAKDADDPLLPSSSLESTLPWPEFEESSELFPPGLSIVPSPSLL